MFEDSLSAFKAITALDILAFLIPFVVAVLVDLLTHKKGEKITMGNALKWSLIWVGCAAAFAGYVWWSFENNPREENFGGMTRMLDGSGAVSLYATGYVLEKALALDNLFAFYLIFKSFGLTLEKNQHYQHRILYWGILGAIVFRVFFLGLGAFIANTSPYVLIAFALIVLWTVRKMWKSSGHAVEIDYTNHWSVNLMRKVTKTNPSIESGHFFSHGVTPLFLCLFCIEICDVVFAFDSMPVIVAVVRDPYLMITSSLWATAGLRSLYFLLVAAQSRLWALDKAIMILLIFVSFKLIASAFGYHLDPAVSVSIVAFILTAGVIMSMAVPDPKVLKE
ncbi:tellurite resistance protein TerC [Prosthecobacter fusiformis]|uniref:Tellurite resistance protein TerC n=1 Tax=Prosthecobacter fusiformis TaxID=48464 RepID=A0A4R7RLT5_9BACT|nr:TerC/Alx family metal homeostasis membrane protein [Prosthecobacter fusiformis]TDU63114.1 tellurite resistance protein TerC [Prosthecobacter fusiformis]